MSSLVEIIPIIKLFDKVRLKCKYIGVLIVIFGSISYLNLLPISKSFPPKKNNIKKVQSTKDGQLKLIREKNGSQQRRLTRNPLKRKGNNKVAKEI